MIKLAAVFSNGAVIQRDAQLRIFGQCDRDVKVSFDKICVDAKCVDGKFLAVFPPHSAGSGYTITVTDGEETITIENVSVGEVIIAAGQSNMEMPLAVTDGGLDELEYCENSNISFYSIPQQYIKGEPLNMFRFQYMDYSMPTWKTCTPDTAKDFSAIGYYVAKKLQKTLGVPVGVIGCNWGCRIIESFIPQECFDEIECLADYKRKHEEVVASKTQEEFDKTYTDFQIFLEERRKSFKNPKDVSFENALHASLYPLNEWKKIPWPQGPYNANRPGCVWHNMLEDVAPYAVKFVLWYQGEGGNADGHYADKYSVMVNAWRKAFKQENLPFYAFELAPTGAGAAVLSEEDNFNWASGREAQRKATLDNKNCYLVTSAGLGDKNCNHPIHKREFAYRAARSLLYNLYGVGKKSDNPFAVSASFDKNSVRIKFQNNEELVLIGPAGVADLYLSSDGKNFVQAQAKIEDNDLVAWSDEIGEACEIRYCYSAYYGCQNIFNSAALPASPFRFVK